MGMYDDIQWDIPQQQPMPDNINWGNIFGQVGEAVNNGVNFINNNPDKVYAPPPRQWPRWMSNSDSGLTDSGTDKGFRAPLPFSPNDYQYNATPNQDFNLPSHRYDSYWTPTPPAPPDPEFSPLENFQQQLWSGVTNYQYAQPQFQQGQETPPLIQPNLPPVPFGQSW